MKRVKLFKRGTDPVIVLESNVELYKSRGWTETPIAKVKRKKTEKDKNVIPKATEAKEPEVE